MRRMMALLTLVLLVLGSSMVFLEQVKAEDNVPTIHIPSTTQAWKQFSKIQIKPVFEDADPDDTLTVSVNMEKEIDHNSSIMDQLPFFAPVKGVNWDINPTTGEFWMQPYDQNIWWDGHEMKGIVQMVLAFEVEDQEGNKANTSIPLFLEDVNEPPEKPKKIHHTPYQADVGELVTFWVDEVSDPDKDMLYYLWDFGDGATGGTYEEYPGWIVNHSFRNEGWKTIQMWVDDGEFSTEKISLRIEVLDAEINWSEKDEDEDTIQNGDDAFPKDPAASIDTDGDGHPDEWNYNKTAVDSTTNLSIDLFPNDPTEWVDSDGDGHGDNSDTFPTDPNEWSDTDGDNIGDNTDAFPNDVAASIDTDYDGFPDEWNPGMSEEDSTTGLQLDSYPYDRDRALSPENEFPYYILFIVLIGATLLSLLLISVLFIIRKRKVNETSESRDLQRYLKRPGIDLENIDEIRKDLKGLNEAGKIKDKTYTKAIDLLEAGDEENDILRGKL